MSLFRSGGIEDVQDVIKYTWFADDVFLTQPPEFKEKLEVVYTVNKEVGKRLMYRYMGRAPDFARNRMCPDQVCKFLGACPMNVPRFYLTLTYEDMAETNASSMDVITPKLWYAHNHALKVAGHFDADMSKVRRLRRPLMHCAFISGNTILEKIMNVSTKPLDIMYMYCGHLTESMTVDMESICKITKNALSVLQGMSRAPEDVHKKLYCENLVRLQLDIMSTLLDNHKLFGVYGIMDFSQKIPSCLMSVLALAVTDILHMKQLSSCNNSIVTNIIRNSKSVEGGLLTSLVKTKRLAGHACTSLLRIMRENLSSEERKGALECADCKGRNAFHHIMLSLGEESDTDMIDMCSWFIRWSPSILLKHDCSHCTPLDYRHDPSFMVAIVTAFSSGEST